MKKRFLTSLALGMFCVGLMAGSALATSLTFNDTINYFPGYGNGTGDDLKDEMGAPRIHGMTVTFDETKNNRLQTVAINVEDRRLFDSLFINAAPTSGDSWDYMIRDNWTYGVDGGIASGRDLYQAWDSYLATEGIYSVNNPVHYKYTLVPADVTQYREKHPDGIAQDDLSLVMGIAPGFVTWDSIHNMLTYDFTVLDNFNIDLGDKFAFAYVSWCANDVMKTPEPSSLLLFGAGIAGLAGIVIGRRQNEEKFLS